MKIILYLDLDDGYDCEHLSTFIELYTTKKGISLQQTWLLK